jgi:hypothetical protein
LLRRKKELLDVSLDKSYPMKWIEGLTKGKSEAIIRPLRWCSGVGYFMHSGSGRKAL